MHTSFPSCHPNSFSLLPSNHLTIMFHQADLICSIQLPASDLAALNLSSVKLIGTQEKNSLTQSRVYTLPPCFSASILFPYFSVLLRFLTFASLNLCDLKAMLFDHGPSITACPDLSVSLRVVSRIPFKYLSWMYRRATFTPLPALVLSA